MKNNVLALAMLFAGALLIYAAVTNKDPRDVIRNTLGAKKDIRPLSTGGGGGGRAEMQMTVTPQTPSGPPSVSI